MTESAWQDRGKFPNLTRRQVLGASGASALGLYGAVRWAAVGSAGGGGAVNMVDLTQAYGVSTSAADNSTAINTALAALGPSDIGYLPPGTYNIQNPIKLGNGSSGTPSTIAGVTLQGSAPPGVPGYLASGPTTTAPVIIQWNGASGSTTPMIQIAGPIIGWGLKNLYLEAVGSSGTAGIGIQILSGQYGSMENVTVVGASSHGIECACQAGSAVSGFNTFLNTYRNISVRTPDSGYGVYIGPFIATGCNTCYDLWDNIFVTSTGTITNGITSFYFGWCDTLELRHVHTGAGGKDIALYYDWTLNNGTSGPQSVMIDNFECGTTAAPTGSKPYVYAAGTVPSTVKNWIRNVNIANQPSNNPWTYLFLSNVGGYGLVIDTPGYPNKNFAPAVPASGTAWGNNAGQPARVIVSGGTVSSVAINGTTVATSTPCSVVLGVTDKITLTYSAAPTWTWEGIA